MNRFSAFRIYFRDAAAYTARDAVGTWRGSEGKKLFVHQWKQCHYKEHRRKMKCKKLH